MFVRVRRSRQIVGKKKIKIKITILYVPQKDFNNKEKVNDSKILITKKNIETLTVLKEISKILTNHKKIDIKKINIIR